MARTTSTEMQPSEHGSPKGDDRPDTGVMERPLRTAALGLKSGLLATLVMTLFRMPIRHSPPPTATFWAKYVAGGDPEDHAFVGLVLHIAYGMGAGLLYAMLSPVHSRGSEVEDELRGVLTGLAFGLLLSVFGSRVILKRVLEQEPDSDRNFIFHLSHVIYGLTLGAWYGAAVDES